MLYTILSSDRSIINDELVSEVETSGRNLFKSFPRKAEETPLPGQLALSWDPNSRPPEFKEKDHIVSICLLWW
jgi:hypothetical protein